MDNPTIGFIGGGRVAKILLSGWRATGRLPASVTVTDANPAVAAALIEQFPEIPITADDIARSASQEIVILALHPPTIGQMLPAIASALRDDAVLVSLAPKWTIRKLAEGLSGRQNIARIIPNAPSIIGEGYNPVAFSPELPAEQRAIVRRIFESLGKMPEVDESKLEAYAVLTAMGPTYFWFQWYELLELARSFGLSDA
jgi:pyrroline-5-carboxylate reductase